MSWRPIVVGVDESDEAVHAAELAVRLAKAAGASCHLVTAIPDAWAATTVTDIPFDVAAFNREIEGTRREVVADALRGRVPDDLIAALHSQLGRPAVVLENLAAKVGAGLVILGGRHHSPLARLLSDSTARHVLRKHDIPVLITGPGDTFGTKVLCSVDLSFAARPTLEWGQELAGVLGAALRVVHVVEPVPIAASLPTVPTEELVASATDRLEKEVWPAIEYPNTDRSVHFGSIVDVIENEVQTWGADLVVLGSHGKGWVDRMLLGSTTERLLSHLPTSMLVIPSSPG